MFRYCKKFAAVPFNTATKYWNTSLDENDKKFLLIQSIYLSIIFALLISVNTAVSSQDWRKSCISGGVGGIAGLIAPWFMMQLVNFVTILSDEITQFRNSSNQSVPSERTPLL